MTASSRVTCRICIVKELSNVVSMAVVNEFFPHEIEELLYDLFVTGLMTLSFTLRYDRLKQNMYSN